MIENLFLRPPFFRSIRLRMANPKISFETFHGLDLSFSDEIRDRTREMRNLAKYLNERKVDYLNRHFHTLKGTGYSIHHDSSEDF